MRDTTMPGALNTRPDTMKAILLQPPYPSSTQPKAARPCLGWMQEQLEQLVPGRQNLVLLPEYATTPGLESRRAVRAFARGAGADFLAFAAATARRLRCLVAVNGAVPSGARWLNRTHLFAADGRLVFAYDKMHLTAFERDALGLSAGAGPVVFTHQGVRYGFATCFDLYFPEHFVVLAANGADVLLCPSYQRGETAERLRTMAQVRALDSGAWLLRSSYAMDRPEVGGRTLVAAPDGTLLADAGAEAGTIKATFAPHRKFVKPASFGRPPVEHRALIEAHRRPATYRPHPERAQRILAAPYPRVCAHRGLSQACPENTLPAFAAAIAAGAHEIEFDLRLSRDGVPVVCHDDAVNRTTNGTGRIANLTWAELSRLDAGRRLGPQWAGVRLPRFEEVLDLVDARVGMNIHIKWDPRIVPPVCDLLRERSLTGIAYLALDSEPALKAACAYAPEIPRACLVNQADATDCIAIARRYACQRIQFFRTVTPKAIRAAHAHGLICNLFWSDEPDDARAYVRKGIDVILTNCTHLLVADGFAPLALR